MRKSTWMAPPIEQVDIDPDAARDDMDDSYQLLGRDTHVRLRSHALGVRPAPPAGEDR